MYDLRGCMEMYGAAIRLAIFDFKNAHRYYEKLEKKRKITVKTKVAKRSINKAAEQKIILLAHHYDSAKQFLFSPKGLERFIDESGLPLEIDYVRRVALDKKPPKYINKNGEPDTQFQEGLSI